jgi:hypothetical protein
MFGRNRCSLFLTFLLASLGVTLIAQSQKLPVKPIKPNQIKPLQPAQAKGVSKPEIKSITIEDNGFELNWLVTIENKGNASSTGHEDLYVYRAPSSGNNLLFANSAPIQVIEPGNSVSLRVTLNPDPAVANYTLKVVIQDKDLYVKPYGLGLPSASIELNQTNNAGGSHWTTKIRNTWVFSLRELKVQIFKKNPSSSAWESIEEKTIGPLACGVSIQSTGVWDPGVNQYKAVVMMRRIHTEPWVQLASQIVTATP